MRRVQCLYGCSTTLHHASTDHAWERPVRDTAVGWTTRARRTPHTGRGQPWAARGGFREAVRARQGLARVASVGRISVQVGLRYYTGVLSPKSKKTPDATPITPSGSPMVCGTPTAPEAAATTRTSSPPPALVLASFFGIFSLRAQTPEHRCPVRLQPLLSHPQDVSYRVLNCCGCLFTTRHRCDLHPNKTPPKGNIFTFSTLHRRHFALTLSPSHGAECAV